MAVTIGNVKQTLEHVSEEQLTGRSQHGSAFETLFQEYWSKVCSLLNRLVDDRDEAEDLAMEVFYRLSRRPHLDAQDQNPGGWIYRVATNLGYNALRSRKRRTYYELKAGLDQFANTSTPNPAQELEKAEERLQVRQALAQMKPRSAQILLMRYSGLPYAEIAAALDLSPTSIGTLLARAEREFEKQYRKLERGQG